MTAAEITLSGLFHTDRFADWICHRARLLDLTGSVTARGRTEMQIVVQGPQALIDAMEMACSLGPMDADVVRIEVKASPHSVRLNGFRKL